MTYDENSTVLKVKVGLGAEVAFCNCECSSIDWGDGSEPIIVDDYIDDSDDELYGCEIVGFGSDYKEAGEYIIELKNCLGFSLDNNGYYDYTIVEIIQIGKLHMHLREFCYCKKLKHIDITIPDTIENANGFGAGCSNLETVNLVFGKGIERCNFLFRGCNNLKKVNLTFNSIPSYYGMFVECNANFILNLFFNANLDKDDIAEFTKEIITDKVINNKITNEIL